MKVLWITEKSLAEREAGGASGTWQAGMAQALLGGGACELALLVPGHLDTLTRVEHSGVAHWFVPGFHASCRPGSLPSAFVGGCVRACREFGPDVVHVWGVETALGLLTARGLLHPPALLEIQGIKSLMLPVYGGGLTLLEQVRCVGLVELKRLALLQSERRRFQKWGRWEHEIIRGHSFIDYQSPWIGAHIKTLNPTARLFKADRALRLPFYEATAWQPQGEVGIFCSAAYSAPFKGLHVAVRALAQLRQWVPNAHLRIAGAHLGGGLRQAGYLTWIEGLVRRLNLVNAVDWLGPLTAEQITVELRKAAAAVVPSFTESYCVALAEAMQVGTPTVVAYTGGTSYLGADEQTCLFFPPGDDVMCAYQLARLLTDNSLACKLSAQGRTGAAQRHNREEIARRQVEIYHSVAALGKPSA